MLGDLTEIFDVRINLHHRPDFFIPISLIDAVHFCRDLQWHAGRNLVQHRIGDRRDQVGRDINAVEFLEVAADLLSRTVMPRAYIEMIFSSKSGNRRWYWHQVPDRRSQPDRHRQWPSSRTLTRMHRKTPVGSRYRAACSAIPLNHAAADWKRPPREWFEAKTQFAVMFKERFVLA